MNFVPTTHKQNKFNINTFNVLLTNYKNRRMHRNNIKYHTHIIVQWCNQYKKK